MSTLLTEADLADQLKVTLAEAVALRRKHHWDHVKLGRFTIRYTALQAEQIIARHTVKTERAKALTEQTDLSARRSA